MDFQDELKEVETGLLELVLQHIEKGTLEPEEAQKLARDFLSLLPIQDKKDLLSKLKTLGKEYDEAQEIYIHELREENEQKRELVLNSMRNSIKKGDIHTAITIAKSHTEQKDLI